jgi:rSAM/selenodomain-associated transferase 1
MVMSTSLKKALILFAKRPVPGRVKTRLTPPLTAGEAAELYRCMLEDILAKTAGLAGVDRHIFYEPDPEAAAYFARLARPIPAAPQRGVDLGERMANAFADLFAAGYGEIAIIGTDLPDLPITYIVESFLRLAEEGIDAVYGPSRDGGYYLLALRELHGDLFRDIIWSSETVLEKSLERGERRGLGMALLPLWHDVDTAEDLERPELRDEGNGAPRTRKFLEDRLGASISSLPPRTPSCRGR